MSSTVGQTIAALSVAAVVGSVGVVAALQATAPEADPSPVQSPGILSGN